MLNCFAICSKELIQFFIAFLRSRIYDGKKHFEPFKRHRNVDDMVYDADIHMFVKQRSDLLTLQGSNLHDADVNPDPKYAVDYDHKVPHLVIPHASVLTLE